MTDGVEAMTEEQFEVCRVRYGRDVETWPTRLRGPALEFIASSAGADHVQAVARMASLFDRAGQQEKADAGDFLSRLADIPLQHEQESVRQSARQSARQNRGANIGGWSFGRRIEQLFEPALLFSVRGLVSQGAFAAVLLVSGVMVGLDAAQTDTFDDYDISAGLFETEDQGFALDE